MRDVVDRLTPFGLMVLTLLDEGDMHPYEMMRLMRQRRDDRFVAITNGTMYHTVARLQRAGLLAEVGVDREGNRPERTTYTLTDSGRDAATEWVRRELSRTDHPADFRVALAEAHNLPRLDVVELLSDRRAALADEYAILRDGRAKALAKGVPEQYLLELERAERLLEAELGWAGDLIRRLDRDDMTWGHAGPETDYYLLDRKAARL